MSFLAGTGDWGVLDNCPQPRGRLEDKKTVALAWKITGLGLYTSHSPSGQCNEVTLYNVVVTH